MAEFDRPEEAPVVDKTKPGWYMSQAGVGDPSVLTYSPALAMAAQQKADADYLTKYKDTTITAKNGPMAGQEIRPIFTQGAREGGRESDNYSLDPKKISGYGFMPNGEHNYFYDTNGNYLFDDGATTAKFNRGMAIGLGGFLGAGALSAAGGLSGLFGGGASTAGALTPEALASLSSADLAAGPMANTLGLEAASLASADLAAGPMANTLGLETATTASTALTPAQIAASDLSVYEPFTKYGSLGAPTNFSGLTAAEVNALTPAQLSQYMPAGSSISNYIKSRYTDGNGNIKWDQALKDAVIVGGAAAAYNQANNSNNGGLPTGYQGKIPEYKAIRGQLAPVEGRRPGAGGQRYLTDTLYSTDAGLPSAQAAVAAQKAALESQNAALPRGAASPNVTDLNSDRFFGRVPLQAMQSMPARPTNQQGALRAGSSLVPGYKDFGADSLAYEGFPGFFAKGGPTSPQGTYLRGETDGMADQIPATIDGKQPARLAHGEFVVPADVVSHLGNGNSDAGAQQLYKMMDRIRMARTGNKKQGKEIDPNKFAPGGIASYEGGGTIASQVASGVTGTESNLSNWVGPYVTNMLGKGQALSEQPYQAYQGPLTAGPSALQTTGFTNAANLATPTSIGQAANTAGNIAGQTQTSSFLSPGTSQAYMNPYMQNVVDIQKQEAQRQADIASTTRQGQQVQAGAYGGSRAAVMDAEAARNLALQQGQIQATGLQSAYDAAAKQFNTEQTTGLAGINTQLAAAQAQGNLGATQNATGLANLNAQLTAGGTQQAIEQAGLTADQAAFAAERDNPYKMVQYQQSLLQGLPLAAQSYNIVNNPVAAAANTGSALYSMFNTAAK